MSACECLDSEPMDILHDKWVTCRKPHKCYECGKEINAGDRVRYQAGFYRGDFMQWWTSPFCERVFSDLERMNYCVLYGGLWELVGEIERGDI